jgi:microcystin-dependent protein
MFGGNFAPAGWAFCRGQLMPISENETLFNLIGTLYGGDGEETFGLPNLQGRLPLHAGQGPGISQSYQLGEQGGVESVTLTTQQIPNHTHAVMVSNVPGSTYAPTSSTVIANCNSGSVNTYKTPADIANNQVTLHGSSISAVGGSQPHTNIQPTLAISYIISLFGVFPSQN